MDKAGMMNFPLVRINESLLIKTKGHLYLCGVFVFMIGYPMIADRSDNLCFGIFGINMTAVCRVTSACRMSMTQTLFCPYQKSLNAVKDRVVICVNFECDNLCYQWLTTNMFFNCNMG